MATRLTIAVGALSILIAVASRMGGGSLLGHLLFTPSAVLHGEIWQVVTYALFVPLGSGAGIFGFLLTLYFLYAIGGQVESVLGPRRFLGFFVGVAALAAVITVPIAYVFGWQHVTHSGTWVSLAALTILFAHHFAHQPIYLFFVLPVQGRQLIVISFGILALYALLDGVGQVLPELVGMLAALAFAYGMFQPRRAWLRFRAWKIERELKRRQSRFSVIRGGREEKKRGHESKDGESGGPWLH
jgi:membrane associated rhomboid family serine protease